MMMIKIDLYRKFLFGPDMVLMCNVTTGRKEIQSDIFSPADL
jgi:hypothetical protein